MVSLPENNMTSKGFTLTELMVVAAIIALLTSLILTNLGNSKAKARDAERVQEMKTLQTALELYQLEFGYPNPGDDGIARNHVSNGENSLTEIMQGLTDEGFLAEIPTPPTGSAYPNEFYYYQTTGEGGDYSCQGNSLAQRDTPYILYFVAELPQKLPKLIDNSSLELDQSVFNMYCLTI
jgi:prepilin-type N-terminal cleavage/methylation domain-containing protein